VRAKRAQNFLTVLRRIVTLTLKIPNISRGVEPVNPAPPPINTALAAFADNSAINCIERNNTVLFSHFTALKTVL